MAAKSDFEFCSVCRRNHGQGRRHIYSKRHCAITKQILIKYGEKVGRNKIMKLLNGICHAHCVVVTSVVVKTGISRSEDSGFLYCRISSNFGWGSSRLGEGYNLFFQSSCMNNSCRLAVKWKNSKAWNWDMKSWYLVQISASYALFTVYNWTMNCLTLQLLQNITLPQTTSNKYDFHFLQWSVASPLLIYDSFLKPHTDKQVPYKKNLQSQPVSCLIYILNLKMSCFFGICFLL